MLMPQDKAARAGHTVFLCDNWPFARTESRCEVPTRFAQHFAGGQHSGVCL